MVHQRSCDITDDDILTWEVQLRREGTLPPQVQARLLEMVRDLTDEIDYAYPTRESSSKLQPPLRRNLR